MENNTDDSTIRVPFNWQFVYNNTSFPEKFEQHLRTLSPGLEEETVRSITKRYIIEKCKSNPFWMAENVGEIRLDLLKSETAMTLNDIKQSTKIMPGRITETNSEASQTHSKPSALNKGSINKHIQKASDNGPSREESQKTSHIEFLPKDLCFDDFLRFTNLESYVKADIVSKNKQNSGKFLRQLDKYLKRHYAVFIKRNKWPKAIQFNDDSIRTLEDFIRMKKLYEKNALDKEKITTESPDMFLCSSESKSGENLKTKTNTCTSPIVLSDDDSLSSLNIQNPQLVEKASMVKIVSKATSKTTPKKTISSPEKTNGITKTQEGQRSDKQPSTSKTQNPKSNDRATKKNIQSEVDSNSSSKDRKRDRVDERCNKCPPTKKMKRAPNIKFLPRDLCFADFLNFTNFESYVKADILAKNKENSHKFMAQLDKYLRKHYGVFVKFKIWPIAIQFHDATIQTLDDFKRAKKQYQEKKITLSPDMFPSSNESKTDKSENNFEADLNRVLDGLDGTCKVQLLVDLLPNTSELSSQKSPDNRIPQYGATCPDNEDAITERFEKPEGAIFIDPANMTRGNQPPMSPSQDPLAITTASDNVSEMNVSSIMSDASHDTTVILNPASQPACPVEDVLPFEAEAMNSIVNDDVSGMTPYHNESISIECDPSENPFSKETLDALHDLIHSMKEYELNDFNLQQEQVQSRGVAHDRSTESADDGTNEVSGETENNNAKLVPPPSQRSVENGNLEGVEIKQDNVYGSQPDADVINTDSDSSVIFVPNETTIDLVDNDADNDEDTLLNLMMAPCMNLSISIEPPSQMPFTMLHVSRETLAADKDLSGKSIIEAIQTNDANSTNIDNKSTLMSTSHNEENLNSTNNTLLNKMMASDETTSTISTPSAVGLMKSTVQTPLKMTSTTEGNVRNQSPSIHTPGAEAIASSDGTCTEDQIGINESSTPVEKNFVTNSASVDIKMDQKMEAAQSSAGKKVGSLNINNNIEQDNQNTQSQACSDDDDVRTVIFEIPEGAEMIDPMNISIHNRTNPPKQEPLAIAAEQLIPSVPSHSSTVIQNPETRNMPADVKKSTDRPDVMCATPSQDDSKNIKFEPSNNQITTDADLAVLRALVCMLNEQNGEVKSSADDYKTLFNLEPGRVEALRAAINESTECHEGVDVVSEETKSNIAILAALSQQSVCVNDNEDCKRDNGANSEIANNSDIIFVPNERNTTIVIEDDDTTSLLLNMMCVESETLLTEENQPRESIIENSELNKSATGANSTNIENNSIVVPAAHSAENLNSTKDILLNKTSENSLSESLIANTVQTPATLAENCNGDSANHENVPIQALHIQTLPPEAMCSEDVACIDERIGINESIEMAPSSTQNNIVQDCASMKMKSVASNVEVGSVNINNNLEPVSDHGNRKKSPSEFQVPFAVPLTRSKSVKRVETGGLNRKQKNPETKKGNKRKAQHAASSKSKKPRKADQPDETTGVSQEKHIFPPLALVVTSRTSQTCLTVPTAKESHSKTPSCRNTENASGIDLDYFIEDVSQCDPSPPQTQPTNISQMLSEDETFLRNLNCTTMKTTHSASAVECSNDKSDSQCEENTEQNTDMPVLRIVTERGYNWFTQLDVESIPGTIISQLIYRSSFALLSPGGKRQTHATCAKKNLTYFLFKIASSRLQFSFNANDADKGRLARILHTLQHPSISPSCPRSDLVAVNGLRSILDYFEEFSAISILEEAIKNAKKKSSVSANSKNTISPQNIDYETFRYGTNIESIFRRRICRKYGDRQTVYLEILETIIQRYYEDHFRVLNKWPAKIKFRDVRIQLPRIKWDGQRKINMSKWFQVYDMKRWERDILKGLIAKKCVA